MSSHLSLDLLSQKPKIRRKQVEDSLYLFDPVRKDWFVPRPEELVRILMIYFLEDRYDLDLRGFIVEKNIPQAGFQQRADLIYYNMQKPILLVECKSFEEKLTDKHMLQLFGYNKHIKAQVQILSNGRDAMAWDTKGKAISSEKELSFLLTPPFGRSSQ